MNDNKKLILSWGVPIFGALCGLIAFFMIFVKAVYTPYSLAESYTGIQVALGCSTTSDYPIFRASAGVIFAFLLPMIAACGAVIGKGYKIVTALSAAAMIAGGALAFSAMHLIRPAITFPTISLAAGPIASGVLSIVGGVALAASIPLEIYLRRTEK